MSVEDKRISRLLEHELVRAANLDVSDVNIKVMHGVGYIGGVIRPATGMHSLNMKNEMRVFAESTRRIPGLRDLVIDAKLESTPRH